MYQFSEKSQLHLATCHADLRNIFKVVIKHRDCTIMEGHRPREKQEEMFLAGKSQLHYPYSKHNKEPSNAVDVAPYFADRSPHIDWGDTEAFLFFAGFVLGVAAKMGIELRWGGNWNMSNDLSDNRFQDLSHFERLEK